jgi:hypothetical protein
MIDTLVEIFHEYYILTLFLLFSTFSVFDIWPVFSADNEFFGIFPEDYYDPNEHDQESAEPVQSINDETFYQEGPIQGTIEESPNSFSENESSTLNFIAAGDWNCNEETKKTIDRIRQIEPELVLGLGDYTFENISPRCWFDISKPIDDILKIAIGNHDLDYQSSYHRLLDHYNLDKPYYSFDFENIHFVTISSEHPFEKGSIQYEFLEDDLEKSLQDSSILWRIVFLHKPLYTASDFDQKTSEHLKITFHELLEKNHVDLLLSGHTQYYQRSLPLSYNNDNPAYPVVMDQNNYGYTDNDGIIFLTAGTAGDKLHNIDFWLPYYVIQERYFGFLNFDLRNNGHTLIGTFYGTDNFGILDKFEVSKDSTGKKTYTDGNSQQYDDKDLSPPAEKSWIFNNRDKYLSPPAEKSWIFNNRNLLNSNDNEYEKI